MKFSGHYIQVHVLLVRIYMVEIGVQQLCKDLKERGWMCPWLLIASVAILFSCAAQADEHHEFYQAFHLNEVLQKC